MVADARNILIDCICEKTGYPAESIGDSQSLESDLGLDSIAKVELLSTVIERLGCELEDIDTDQLDSAKTVGDLIKIIEALG